MQIASEVSFAAVRDISAQAFREKFCRKQLHRIFFKWDNLPLATIFEAAPRGRAFSSGFKVKAHEEHLSQSSILFRQAEEIKHARKSLKSFGEMKWFLGLDSVEGLEKLVSIKNGSQSLHLVYRIRGWTCQFEAANRLFDDLSKVEESLGSWNHFPAEESDKFHGSWLHLDDWIFGNRGISSPRKAADNLEREKKHAITRIAQFLSGRAVTIDSFQRCSRDVFARGNVDVSTGRGPLPLLRFLLDSLIDPDGGSIDRELSESRIRLVKHLGCPWFFNSVSEQLARFYYPPKLKSLLVSYCHEMQSRYGVLGWKK